MKTSKILLAFLLVIVFAGSLYPLVKRVERFAMDKD
jgi:hypothetical protein